MNLEKNPSSEPVNYGRDGKGHVNIPDRIRATMDALMHPNKKQEETYAPAGELNKDIVKNPELSATEIKAIAGELKKVIPAIKGAADNIQFSGLDAQTIEKLKIELVIIKEEALKNNNITEEVYSIKTTDSNDVREAKETLQLFVESIEKIVTDAFKA